MYVVFPFKATVDPNAPLDGAWILNKFKAQSSYVQDCDIKDGCYYRLCSTGSTMTKNYIEIYPVFQVSDTPMLVPIHYTPFLNSEYEGITSGGGKTYLNCGNTIIFSTQMENSMVVPQIGTNDTSWANDGPINYNADIRGAGLPHEDTSQIAGFPSNMILVKYPGQFNEMKHGRQLTVQITSQGIESHAGGVSVPIPFQEIPWADWEQFPQGFINTIIFGNLSNGFYSLVLQLFNDSSSLSANQPHLGVVVARYTEVLPSGTTTKTSDIVHNFIKVRIN
jgi:hypothetical protein